MRYFALRVKGKEVAVFTGKAPRHAALKAATRGYVDIELRERGTNKVHVFKGFREKVPAPAGIPWSTKEVWKPGVKKVKMYKLK
jgi:hypothetical protein